MEYGERDLVVALVARTSSFTLAAILAPAALLSMFQPALDTIEQSSEASPAESETK